MSAIPDALADQVSAWIAHDPDPETRAQTRAMVDADDADGLAACFAGLPRFGTAGIRAELGPGPSRINRATVRRVAAGLAAALAATVGRQAGPVVVGFDGRRGSAVFAEDAARVLTGAGFAVRRFAHVVPTPVLAFAVRELGGCAGVMITASHNPPGDNGIKVYGADGAQIVAPLDGAIWEAATAAADPALGPDGEPVPATLVDAYVARVLGLRVHPGPHRAPVRIAYTPLHGVGRDTVLRVLRQAGYSDVHVVADQAEPDGAFPTLPFPNPEEPGALDRVIALAGDVGAPLVLANDPDADRIAVAVAEPGGGYRALTGNEIGTLLAEDLLRHGATPPGGRRRVATTVVSSALLGAIAQAHDADCVRTWTGFKWIARAAASAPGRFVLGYEEALGVCAGEVVRDKDGVSAALLVADLATHLAAQGLTLLDALDALHVAHGVHAGAQVTLKLPIPQIARAMAALRAGLPVALGRIAVTRWVDHLREVPEGLPPADLLVAWLETGDRALFRPSGTEPKLKVYLEAVEPVIGGRDGLAAARAVAEARLAELRAAGRAAVERAAGV